MRRRNVLGLLIGAGLSGCLGSADSESRTATPSESTLTDGRSTQSQTPAATSTAENRCGVQYLQYGEWHQGHRMVISVNEVNAYSKISSSATTSVSLPDGQQFLSIRITIKNPADEARKVCGICNEFGVIEADKLVDFAGGSIQLPSQTVALSKIEQGADVPVYPPDEAIEPGERREVRVGTLISDQFDPSLLRIGYGIVGEGFYARWEKEGNTQSTACEHGTTTTDTS